MARATTSRRSTPPCTTGETRHALALQRTQSERLTAVQPPAFARIRDLLLARPRPLSTSTGPGPCHWRPRTICQCRSCFHGVRVRQVLVLVYDAARAWAHHHPTVLARGIGAAGEGGVRFRIQHVHASSTLGSTYDLVVTRYMIASCIGQRYPGLLRQRHQLCKRLRLYIRTCLKSCFSSSLALTIFALLSD